MASMERALPVEVWLQIFRFACVDGGETGCALSLVSTYIHHISLEVRYQCIAARIDQLPLLASVLRSVAPENKRIKHILLDTREEMPSRDSVTGKRTEASGVYVKFHHDAIYGAYAEILAAASSSLLSFFGNNLLKTNPRHLLLPVACPALVSASFHGNLPLFLTLDHPPGLPPIFPALRYLSIGGFPDYPVHFFERIAFQAPNLTHLFLLPQRSSPALESELQNMLPQFNGCDLPPNSLFADNATFSAKLPPNIKVVCIQAAGQSNSFSWSSYGYSRYGSSSLLDAVAQDALKPREARQRWVDAAEAKIYIPTHSTQKTYFSMPAKAEIMKSTTRTVTYDE